jgi:hypothetical protein
MRKFFKNLYPIRLPIGLGAAALVCAASSLAQAQAPPLVYSVENTGANYPAVTLPDFAHAPINRQMVDPFVFANGTRDTSAGSLEQHRNEWMSAVLQTEEGPKPSCTGTSADTVLGVPYICSVTASYTTTSANHYTLTVVVTVVGPNGTNTLSLPAAIVTPTASSTCVQPANGWPYVIGMGSATGSWPASAFNASTASPSGVTVKPTGCAATVVYNLNNVAAYTAGTLKVHNTDPFYKLYPNLCAGLTTVGTAGACNAANGFPNGSNSGEYAAWSWGISRLLDGLQKVATQPTNPLPLDTGHSAVTGCSYAGKMAMWGGALDERVALTISQENGGGGAPSWLISHEIEVQGSVENVNDTDYDWFDSTLKGYSGPGVYKLPEDHFELMAMVAPRAILETGDANYYWLGDRSATFDALATQKVYDNYGIDDRFNYYNDTVHSHCVVPAYQQNATQPIINKFMFGATAPSTLNVSELMEDSLLVPGVQPTLDPNMWTAWWGTGTPAFPAGDVWNNGGDVMLPLNQNITVNTGDTIATTYAMTMPGTHAAATISVPTAYTEVDIACTDGTSYTLTVPPVNASGYETDTQSYTIGANNNSTFTSNVNTAVNPGCGNGAPGHTTGTYFFALGKSNPGAGNPGLAGFSTTNGLQASGVTDPLNVTFNLADTTNNQGGTYAPWTTINRLNPYSCTAPGCPLTPTINWTAPSPIPYGTALSATQLNAAASSTLISGFGGAGTSGLPVTASIPGTWSYNPPAGTVLNAGVQTLTATFTPTAIITSATTAANAYKAYTISTASVPLTVAKANQTITFTGLPTGVNSGSPSTFTLTGTASSGLPVSYTVTGPATISGSTLNISGAGAGSVVVTASQAGNSNYNAAAPVSQTIVIGTVQLTTSAVLSKTAGGYQAVVTVANSGTGTASNVQLTVASLGSASGSVVPASLGTVAGGGSSSVTITFPSSAGVSGAGVVEKLSGTYTGGTFGGSFRVVLPN